MTSIMMIMIIVMSFWTLFLVPIRYQGTDKVTYNTYGVTCTEVELDVLTGERQISRTDILYDCGQR